MAWLEQQVAAVPLETVVLLFIALFISASGFYKTVYFVSIGYAFSIAAMAVLAPLLFRDNLTWYGLLHCGLLLIYGLRLGIYLLRRESTSTYKRELELQKERTAGMTDGVRFLIWIAVSLLYVAMFSPALFTLATPQGNLSAFGVTMQITGAAVMVFGIGLETLADKQKSDFKAINPKRFCDVGLYRWVRCPNYLGEIIFWLGNMMMGVPFYSALVRWVIALAGLVCITLIMMGSTKRLEQSQDERYGAMPEYQRYVSSVPVLFPFVPVYTLKNIRVYLE